MKFSHCYKLKKDLPTYPKGWDFRWSGNRELFFPHKRSEWEFEKGKPSIYLDLSHGGYTIEQIKNEEWFEPEGDEVDFIPKFPEKEKIENFIDLFLQTRLVNDVDECRCLNKLFQSENFENDFYEFLKKSYNKFYNL